MNDDRSKIDADLQTLLERFDHAFGKISPPEGWQDSVTIEHFERLYGHRFLPEYWELIDQIETSVSRYVLPFVMRYFAVNLNSGTDDGVNLDMLLLRLDPSTQLELFGTRPFFDVVSQYSQEQREVICDWLRFVIRYQTVPIGLEGDELIESWS